MILTENAIIWRRSFIAKGPRGESCVRYDCPGHPRLFRLVQQTRPDARPVETFHVDGLAQVYHDERSALTALKANPR